MIRSASGVLGQRMEEEHAGEKRFHALTEQVAAPLVARRACSKELEAKQEIEEQRTGTPAKNAFTY